MAVVVMMMMVMAVNYNHNLRLRYIRHCDAENDSQSKQDCFHSLLWRTVGQFVELD